MVWQSNASMLSEGLNIRRHIIYEITTISRYMKACQIRGFVEEIGYEVVDLLDGAGEEKSKEDEEGPKFEKVDRSGLIAATGSIVQATTKVEDDEIDGL